MGQRLTSELDLPGCKGHQVLEDPQQEPKIRTRFDSPDVCKSRDRNRDSRQKFPRYIKAVFYISSQVLIKGFEGPTGGYQGTKLIKVFDGPMNCNWHIFLPEERCHVSKRAFVN